MLADFHSALGPGLKKTPVPELSIDTLSFIALAGGGKGEVHMVLEQICDSDLGVRSGWGSSCAQRSAQ